MAQKPGKSCITHKHAKQAKTQPHQQNKKQKKFPWSPELMELLLKYVRELKLKCEFNENDDIEQSDPTILSR